LISISIIDFLILYQIIKKLGNKIWAVLISFHSSRLTPEKTVIFNIDITPYAKDYPSYIACPSDRRNGEKIR